MESKSGPKPILLYVSENEYKDFQKASEEDWVNQLKKKSGFKEYKAATELYNKIEQADIVIYGPVLQKCDDLGKGVIPDDLFDNFDNSYFWPRLLEKQEINDIKSKCHVIEFKANNKVNGNRSTAKKEGGQKRRRPSKRRRAN